MAATSDVGIDELPISELAIRFDLSTPDSVIASFKKALLASTGMSSDQLHMNLVGEGDTETTSKVSHILNIVFNIITALTMFMCFFALSANMSANLWNQSKEIGVLRAMGFTSWRIKMLYFYEATVLVLASCMMGIIVGCFVAYTFILQQSLVLQVPTSFFFPWQQFLIVFVASFICAIFSTFGPVGMLTKLPISQIFRKI